MKSRTSRPLSLLAATFLALTSCAAPQIEMDTWRQQESAARPLDQRGGLDEDLARVEKLRNADKLPEARALALALAAEQPDHARVAFLASRAESDGLALFAKREKEVRNAAAASALVYARRAEALGESSVEARAQFAWALGSSTHLQPMTARSDHARHTIAVAMEVLERDPAEPRALATLAVVNLRLESLPWIARVMARSRPDSSLEDAIAFAYRAVHARQSVENRVILAKCLRAADQDAQADAVLAAARAASFAYPRDSASMPNLGR